MQNKTKSVQYYLGSFCLMADVTAKVLILRGFRGGARSSQAPHGARSVLRAEVRGVCPRTIWSLSNAFTSAFKDLDPPQFRATAKLGEFLEVRFSQSYPGL